MAKEPFLTIAGIKVEAGKPCKDPRMMSIDLRKHIRVVKVTVVGPDKKPIRASVSHHVIRGRGSSTHGYSTDDKGVCVLMLPKEGGHVSVQGRDGEFLPQRFPMLKEDVVVQMKPALLVKLQLQGLPKLPDNLQFRMDLNPKVRKRLKREDNWGRYSYRSWSTLPGDGKAELYVDKPGDYRLTLVPVLLSQGGRSTTHLNRGRIQLECTVKKLEQGAKAQTVELKLDEDQLESVKDLVEEAKEAKKDGEDR